MPVLRINNTTLDYSVRRSRRARYQRINISTDKIEVVVPYYVPPKVAQKFIHDKKHWVYSTWRRLQNHKRECIYPSVTSYEPDSTIKYLGKKLKLLVCTDQEVIKPTVEYKRGLRITLPEGMSEKRQAKAIRDCLRNWIKEDMARKVADISRFYAHRLKLKPKTIRIKQQKTMWGSCSSDGDININLCLAFAPYEVFEYVVVHELCHLKHADHSHNFWGLVGRLMPDYEHKKNWLNNKAINSDSKL